MRWISNKFKPAFLGLIHMMNDSSIRLQLMIALCVIMFGLIYSFNINEWMWIILCIFLVLITEIINTAIERTCDLIDLNTNNKIKYIKDLSACAVLLSGIFSIIIGICILKGALR